MKKRALITLLAGCLAWNAPAQTRELPRTEPETVGIPHEAITALMDSLMSLPQTSIHSLMVLRHGQVVGEAYPTPFKARDRHIMYSCSKTFLAAGIGIAIGEGKLAIDSKVAAFFPMQHTDAQHFNSITVRDLLVMASGIEPDWDMRNNTDEWTHTWLSKPIAEPGKVFKYDSMCTYMLSAILQKATGMKALDYIDRHIFQPLHITDVGWEESPEGFNTGGWGLHIQSESLAKFGQLLLQKGRWNGQQVIPEWWVNEMMKKQIDNGGPGYGYQMWACEQPEAWRADGAYGQYILVIPTHDMVVVITECTTIDGVRQRRLVWNVLLPQAGDHPLRCTDAAAYHRQMNQYALPLPSGTAHSTTYRGEPKTVVLHDQPKGWSQLSFAQEGDTLLFSYVQEGEEVRIPLLHRQWTTVSTTAHPVYTVTARHRFEGLSPVYHVAGSYAYGEHDDLCIRLHYTNWITPLTITIHDVSQPQPTADIREMD